MINCKICNKQFVVISNSHLKKHNISCVEYKNQYGIDALTSPEYETQRRNTLSISKRGKPAYNRGISMSEEQKIKLSILARERYREGKHPMLGTHRTPETKKKLSIASSSKSGTEMALLRGQKAAATKKSNGYKPQAMLGKKHTLDVKNKMSETIKALWKERKAPIYKKLNDRIIASNLLLINNIDDHFLHLQCNICYHEFNRTKQVFIDSKYTGLVCPICYPPVNARSDEELSLLNYIKTITSTTILVGNRSQIYPLELDIYLPDLNMAIEYCGLYWHSELTGKDHKYHLHKMNLCQAKNITLITIFSDEWLHKPEIVKAKLRNLLNIQVTSIGARKCSVHLIDSKTISNFLNSYHLQGNGRSNIGLGLFYNTTLVSIMTFSKSNLSRKQYEWEINRYCSLPDIRVMGGASKLFNQFINMIHPNTVITYADLRWSTGLVYEKIGFHIVNDTPPNYWYIDGTKRIHRFGLRKTHKDNPLLTEWENRKLQGWNRIWDCGNRKYIWKK